MDSFIEQTPLQESGNTLPSEGLPSAGERPLYASSQNTAAAHLPALEIQGLNEPVRANLAGFASPPQSAVTDCLQQIAGSGVPVGTYIDMAKLAVFSYQCKSK